MIILRLRKFVKILLRNNVCPDPCKTKRMCDKVIVENGAILGFIPESCKDKKMCNKLLIIILMH